MNEQEAEAPSANSAHVEVTSPMSTNEISSSIASPSSTNDVHSQDSETLHVTQELLDGVCKMFRSLSVLSTHWRFFH